MGACPRVTRIAKPKLANDLGRYSMTNSSTRLCLSVFAKTFVSFAVFLELIGGSARAAGREAFCRD
jgi:hypothetical protein